MKAGDKYQACVDALAAYAKGVGFSQVVIGLSGGIDSSVTAVMAVDAFGAKNVHGVLLPGPYSTGHSIDDALTLAENLGIESHTVSICEPFEAFEQVIRKSYKEKLEGLASENTQARCRMVILMALSNANRWMLVNTGNKSEAAMGYSTAIRRARLPRSAACTRPMCTRWAVGATSRRARRVTSSPFPRTCS